MTLLYPQALILLVAAFYLYRLQPEQKRLPLVLALMIVALSRPVIFKTERNKSMEATEAVIALDLSRSMRADDIRPSRLEAAKEAIKKLIAESPQNRYALFGFTINPLILSPYTSDTRLLAEAVDAIEAENILTKGTSIKKLLRYLARQKIPVKNLILFSDGGEERDAEALAEIAKKAGIRIIAVGVASHKGAMLKDSYGKTLKMSDGALVVSRLNPLLPKLSEMSGGRYVPFTTPEETAHEVSQVLDEIAEKSRFSQREAGYEELYWIPLLIALILFFFHFTEIPRKIWLLLPFIAQSGDAYMLDWYYIHKARSAWQRHDYPQTVNALQHVSHKTIASEFDRALALYRQQKYRDSVAVLVKLHTRDPQLKQQILFLLGNCYVRMKRYEKASAAYQQALLLGYDERILQNLTAILGKKSHKVRKPPAFKKKKGNQKGVAANAGKKRQKKSKEQHQSGRVKRDKKRVLGYKAYELINKGYIDEKKPW